MYCLQKFVFSQVFDVYVFLQKTEFSQGWQIGLVGLDQPEVSPKSYKQSFGAKINYFFLRKAGRCCCLNCSTETEAISFLYQPVFFLDCFEISQSL
jgi:hypothetical protein